MKITEVTKRRAEVYFMPCARVDADRLIISQPDLIIPLHLRQTHICTTRKQDFAHVPSFQEGLGWGTRVPTLSHTDTRIDSFYWRERDDKWERRKIETRLRLLHDNMGKDGILVMLLGDQPYAYTSSVMNVGMEYSLDNFDTAHYSFDFVGHDMLLGGYTVRNNWARARYDQGDGTYIEKWLTQDIPVDDWLILRYNKW